MMYIFTLTQDFDCFYPESYWDENKIDVYGDLIDSALKYLGRDISIDDIGDKIHLALKLIEEVKT